MTSIPCQSEKCLNGNPPSGLECPQCKTLSIKGSFFCNQECFKKNWKAHKQAQHPDIYDPFPASAYMGKLRAVYPLSARRSVPEPIPRPDYAEDGNSASERARGSGPIRILNKEEQEGMRIVCKLARIVLDDAASHLRPGITTDEIDEIVHKKIVELGAYPSPLSYRNFPKSVCTSINEVICHGIPDRRKLVEGDIINLDVTLFYKGYHGDVNATYPVGQIRQDHADLIRVTREALDKAIAVCKPGALFRDIGKAIQDHVKPQKTVETTDAGTTRNVGFSIVRTYTGHGIHELFHCTPNIPHYESKRTPGIMKAGMTFTIEPMINLGPSYDVEHWPDNWTATTLDGRFSAQFEETLLITETGVEVLTGEQSAVRADEKSQESA